MDPLRISIRSNKAIYIIDQKEILYCMADGRYTRIFLVNGESHLIAKVLRQYEVLLPKDTFFRIHKSCIVNLSFIKEYCFNSHRSLKMNDDTTLLVSKRRCKCFIHKIEEIYPSSS